MKFGNSEAVYVILTSRLQASDWQITPSPLYLKKRVGWNTGSDYYCTYLSTAGDWRANHCMAHVQKRKSSIRRDADPETIGSSISRNGMQPSVRIVLVTASSYRATATVFLMLATTRTCPELP